MNAEQLLTHFDRIADAPDAIPRLRRFILDLAVRGKLVEQDPNDEPASELLRRIAAEKARLTKTGEIKKTKALPPISEDHVKFETPKSWSWCRLGSLSKSVTSGSRDWAKYYSQEGAIFIRMGNLSKEHYRLRLDQIQHVKPPSDREGTRTRLKGGDLLISITGDVGMLGLIPENFGEAYINQHTAMVRPVEEMKGRYLAELFRSPFAQDQFNAPQRGIKNSFRLTDIIQFLVPLPPLTEQHRIIAKVDELMALCDRLEAARTERETTRDRLTATSLARLNTPDPVVFQNHAVFALNNLTPLTTLPDQIKALRQTILNLAVRGKLVEQESSEGGVDDLLEEFGIQQKRLIAEKKLKRSVSTCNVEIRDELASIPKSWRWVPLGKLISFGPQNGISPRATNSTDAPRAITLTATTSGTFDASHFKHVEADVPADSEYWLRDGDLLFQRGNTREYVGIAAYFSGVSGVFLYPDLIIKVRLLNGLCLPYVHLALVSPGARTYFSTNATGAQETMPKINQQTLLDTPVPLAPLAEQHRIVAKVDELMAVCDRLEASLITGDETRGRLVEATLHEALN